jgi:hypothetical protein
MTFEATRRIGASLLAGMSRQAGQAEHPRYNPHLLPRQSAGKSRPALAGMRSRLMANSPA